MSLLRLLTTGKSLVSVRDTESRYRLTTQRSLPQFGPARNPFSQRETESVPAAGIQPDAATRKVSAKPGVWGSAQALWLRAAALWSGSKAQPGGLLAQPRRAVAKPAIPQFSKAPVQGELSLDRVEVVRNDLSEADLEVVPAKPEAASNLMTVGPAGAVESVWGRMTPRFFHAGKR